MPLLRSLLFAPGNVARRVEKALSLAADAVIVDLEDSVAISDKEATRKPVADELDTVYDLADAGPDPEMQTVTKDEGRRIDTCMEELEADRAVAVKRAYVEGLSYQELADQFGVPLNTMRTWLRRSLLKLRECMER